MKHPSIKKQSISRRQLLPLLGSIFFVPFLGFGNSKKEPLPFINHDDDDDDDDAYQTLLKPDGTAVKVKVSTIKKSKIIKEKISNKSFLHWLGRKL
jgi:hypothetical protein